MIQRMLASAVFAGFVAGLFAALLHFAFVQDLILLGEQYETGALTHFENASAPPEHGHDSDATQHGHGDPEQSAAAPAGGGGSSPSDLTRNTLTVLFTVLIYVAYAMILISGFALANQFGHHIGVHEGVLWGIGGFAAFQMAPALGLAPELPGTIAADLGGRQIWWWGTVLATATGIALAAYGRGLVYAVAAVALLAAPHVIGAPQADGFWGVAPPEVGALFTARVLGVGLAVWVVLGGLAGWFWSRDKA